MGGARALAITEPIVAPADLDHAERLHDRVVEPLGGGNVGYGYGNVVQHRLTRVLQPLQCFENLFLPRHRRLAFFLFFLDDLLGRVRHKLLVS